MGDKNTYFWSLPEDYKEIAPFGIEGPYKSRLKQLEEKRKSRTCIYSKCQGSEGLGWNLLKVWITILIFYFLHNLSSFCMRVNSVVGTGSINHRGTYIDSKQSPKCLLFWRRMQIRSRWNDDESLSRLELSHFSEIRNPDGFRHRCRNPL